MNTRPGWPSTRTDKPCPSPCSSLSNTGTSDSLSGSFLPWCMLNSTLQYTCHSAQDRVVILTKTKNSTKRKHISTYLVAFASVCLRGGLRETHPSSPRARSSLSKPQPAPKHSNKTTANKKMARHLPKEAEAHPFVGQEPGGRQ